MTKRSNSLDIIRIVAAGFVFLVHLGQFTGVPREGQNGFYGVWLFFILSGYLIFVSLDKDEASGTNSFGDTLKKYYLKRFVRICPLYWTILVVIWIYDLLKGVVLEGQSVAGLIGLNGVCGPKFLRYFVFGQMFIPSDYYERWNNRYALWTMSAFALFYVIAPFIKKVSNSFLKSLFVLFVFFKIHEILPEIIRNACIDTYGEGLDIFPEMNALCVMYLFWIGACAYYAVKEEKQIIYASILAFSYAFYICRGNEYDVIFAAMVMLAASTSFTIKNEKVNHAITLMSSCSFTLYLTHMLWFDFATRAFSYLGVGMKVKFPVMVCGAFIIAYATYRIVTPIEDKIGAKLLKK